jgi:hypothetical protein
MNNGCLQKPLALWAFWFFGRPSIYKYLNIPKRFGLNPNVNLARHKYNLAGPFQINASLVRLKLPEVYSTPM